MIGRILALDVGRRRIGVAVSDALGLTAQGLPTLERGQMRADLAQLARIVRENEVVRIVVGLPLQMSGTEGKQAEYVREFAGRVERETGVPAVFWDERFTTVEANRVLRESGVGLEKRIKAVDKLSAVILLESYLDSIAHTGGTHEE